jgi:hypothetical protein
VAGVRCLFRAVGHSPEEWSEGPQPTVKPKSARNRLARAVMLTCRISAPSPHPNGGWSSTSTTSTRRYPGPFEWDVMWLVASMAVAGRDNGLTAKKRRRVALATAAAYRTAMRGIRRHVDPGRLIRPLRRRGRPCPAPIRPAEEGGAPNQDSDGEGSHAGRHAGAGETDDRQGGTTAWYWRRNAWRRGSAFAREELVEAEPPGPRGRLSRAQATPPVSPYGVEDLAGAARVPREPPPLAAVAISVHSSLPKPCPLLVISGSSEGKLPVLSRNVRPCITPDRRLAARNE